MWTKEICEQKWFKDLRKEIVWANFWGFSGLNIDPINNKTYKYPISQIDPINRMLRQSTYNFADGIDFAQTVNLLFVQHSTSYERFLGWMQPITREFIMMNMNSMNWIQAGKRLAFPLLKIGYPAINNNVNDQQNLVSPFRAEAENYASSLDPSKTLISPYIIDREGNKISALDIDSKDTSGKQNAHKIYQEFNTDQKNDIRELVFGGTLTSNAGKFGTKGLGEVHADKLQTAIAERNEEVLAVLNDEHDFLWKIKKFYRNFPDNLRFSSNMSKEFNIDEIKLLSDSAVSNGLKLTKEFFLKYGLEDEDIEDNPAPLPTVKDGNEELSVTFDKTKRSLFGVKKKVY